MLLYLFILFIVFPSLALILLLLCQPQWILRFIESVILGAVYFAKTNKLIIALTIDDTPDVLTTPLILEVLKQNNIKATFFIISNQIIGNENIVESIVNDGHELGNHMTEDKPSIKMSPEEFEQDLLQAHSIISRFSKAEWMRPASGCYNKEMLKVAKNYNYRVALGSVYPYDTHIKLSWFSINHILFNVRPGSIIVLHDGNSRGHRTAKTLAKILPILKGRGYQFATLSQLFSES
jgi:peptidoglycan/xylan/chitin deacetylase (PgdA/CDA1 family)